MAADDDTESYREPARKVVGILSGEWTIAILYSLATQPCRYVELLDDVNRNEARLSGQTRSRQVARKVFTNTLRTLERNGLITHAKGEGKFAPAWYQLTPLGGEFLRATVPLAKLGIKFNPEIDAARARYDDTRPAPTDTTSI